jgi:hypothetical protein
LLDELAADLAGCAGNENLPSCRHAWGLSEPVVGRLAEVMKHRQRAGPRAARMAGRQVLGGMARCPKLLVVTAGPGGATSQHER